MMNLETWPLWLKVVIGLLVAFLTLFNLLPSELFNRKLTKRERILCVFFGCLVLVLILIAFFAIRTHAR